MEVLSSLSRWIHILAGIVWIGMLYFFNFVNGPFQGTMDGETKKKVNPELMPRALYFFRWGAAWTWFTGVLLLLLVFYHGGITLEPEASWGAGSIAMVAVTFLAPFVYDALHKSPLGKDPKTFGGICLRPRGRRHLHSCTTSGFTYRAYNIHMAGAVRDHHGLQRLVPDLARAAEDHPRGQGGHGPRRRPRGPGGRALAPQHLHVGAAALGHDRPAHGHHRHQPRHPAAYGFVLFLLVTLVGWHLVFQLYKMAGKVKGF